MNSKNPNKPSVPAKFWIDGRVYDIDKSKENQFDIETAEERYFTKFHLPKFYYQRLTSKYADDLEAIKKRTTTDIFIPHPRRNGKIRVSGRTKDNVVEARDELHAIIHQIRSAAQPKQFIAIPTLSDEITTNFNSFKENLMNRNPKIEGLSENIFQKAAKLHLTLCVFALFDSFEENEGKRLLAEVKNEILMPLFKDKHEIVLKLKGIGSMQTNLKKCNVLYTNAEIVGEDEHFNLQSVANKITDFFYEKGLLKESKDGVKIHVTLINTKYRSSRDVRKGRRWEKRIPFDASIILEEFADYVFGLCPFNSLHLSLMGSYVDQSAQDFPGFYAPLAIETLKFS